MNGFIRRNLEILPFVGFGLIGIAPILIAVGACWVAKLYGYELHEGFPPDDSQVGRTLYQMGVAGWYFLFTVPAAVCLSIVYAMVLQVRKRTKDRK